LVFAVHDSSEPAKSLTIFYDLLKKIGSNGLVSFKEFCNPREMDTAKAGILYRWVNSRATSGAVIGTLLRNQLRVRISGSNTYLHIGIWHIRRRRSSGAQVFK
jgi:hypothetical protein